MILSFVKSVVKCFTGLERSLKGARGVVKINTCGYCGIKIDAEELFCNDECANFWYENLEESNYNYGE